MVSGTTISFCLMVIAAYFTVPDLLQAMDIEITMYVMALAMTALIAGLVIKSYRRDWLFITDRADNVVFQLTRGVLLLYLADLLLLIFFSVPISVLHEGTVTGILFSIIIIFIVMMNLARDYSNFKCSGLKQEQCNKKYEEDNFHYSFAFGVSLFWLFIEITGLMLKL